MNTPPHSNHAEQGLIGSMLIDNDIIDYVLAEVKAEHFYSLNHQEIFKAVRSLKYKSKPVDLITLSDELERLNALEQAGGFSYIAELAKNTPSSASYKTYCDTIKEKADGRALIAAANQLQESIYGGNDYYAAREQCYKNLESIGMESSDETIADAEKLTEGFLDELERITKANGMTGIPTGFKYIDERTGGLNPGDYIALAARSGGGKTTLALNILRNVVMNGKRALMFSMEMKKNRVMMKLCSDLANVELDRIKNNLMEQDEWYRMSKALKDLKETKLHIDDSSGITITDIERRAKQLRARYGELDLIVIDYIQRIKIDGANMYAEMTAVSNSLKDLFMKLGCSGIVLAQLKKNSVGFPKGSDLRETGAIENDSDVVMFLHSDTPNLKPQNGCLTALAFDKVRFGETGVSMLVNQLRFQRFASSDQEYVEPQTKGSKFE